MKKYRVQGTEKIESLKKEIEIINLADMICGDRLNNGVDRFPIDINWMIKEIKSLHHLDTPSIYAVLYNKKF